MGFSNGAAMVKPFLKSKKLSTILLQFGKGHVLIDASGILHAALSAHASSVCRGDWISYDRDIASRLNANEDVAPVFVFDGYRSTAKRVNDDRQKQRDEANALGGHLKWLQGQDR